MSVEAKQQKQQIIDEIKGKLETAQSAVVIDYMGINVAEADAEYNRQKWSERIDNSAAQTAAEACKILDGFQKRWSK